jgi:hypothetical protein
LLGLGFGLPQIYGVMKPKEFAASVRKFPRSLPWGIVLMLLGTFWFLYNLQQESIADFKDLKPYLMMFFGLVGVGSCLFVQDFLAVRGFAVVVMLIAKQMVDTARWADSDWRLALVIWAYLMVAAGIWFTIWPWHMRDLLNWGTASEKRVRVGSAVRLGWGLFIAVLGFTVFRAS